MPETATLPRRAPSGRPVDAAKSARVRAFLADPAKAQCGLTKVACACQASRDLVKRVAAEVAPGRFGGPRRRVDRPVPAREESCGAAWSRGHIQRPVPPPAIAEAPREMPVLDRESAAPVAARPRIAARPRPAHSSGYPNLDLSAHEVDDPIVHGWLAAPDSRTPAERERARAALGKPGPRYAGESDGEDEEEAARRGRKLACRWLIEEFRRVRRRHRRLAREGRRDEAAAALREQAQPSHAATHPQPGAQP